MTASLLVIEPGLSATLQDLGRPGYQALGVPASGALDPVMLRIANWLAGNEGGEGAIEMRYSGPVFEVLGGPVLVGRDQTSIAEESFVGRDQTSIAEESFVGRDQTSIAAQVRVALSGDGAGLRLMLPDEQRIPAYRSVLLTPGQRFRVMLRGGGACYLAVAGGFAIAPVLGSVSTLTVARLGGFDGRPLAAGDVLPLRALAGDGCDHVLRPPEPEVPDRLRVILGPQDDHFSQAAIQQFLTQSFKVSHHSNRMGLRLECEPLRANSKGFDLISDGNAPGSVQVPGSGRPIILLADRGTTGGYPKIATVISADLPALGRIAPGGTVHFQAVTHAEAVAALRAQQAWLAGVRGGIQPCRDAEATLTRALLEENIISGVSDARH